MAEQKIVYEIAILGRVTWNLHSLNNEGNIGNVVEPRTVKLADGQTVDGISGEMMKHVHAAKVWELQADKSKFCPVCQVLEPMRADRNDAVRKFNKGQEVEAVNQALTDCIMCDLHGFLVQRPTVHRQSTVEFGWTVGLRGQTHRDIHQHARHAVGFKGEGKAEETQPAQAQMILPEADVDSEVEIADTETTEDNPERQQTSQMLFSRPTRSGTYAIATVLQPWRIGLNTVNYTYPKLVQRVERYKLALRAYRAMFLRMDGAMTSTRLPHLEKFEGAVVVTSTNEVAPVFSPLEDDYLNKLNRLKDVDKNLVDVYPFFDVVEFVAKLKELESYTPYSLKTVDAGVKND